MPIGVVAASGQSKQNPTGTKRPYQPTPSTGQRTTKHIQWTTNHFGFERMVFVLDNYDSFTYNLVQYMGELGADILVRRNDELTPAQVEALHPSQIVISPGPCTPQDAGISIDLVRHFARRARQGGPRVPILGVCLGHRSEERRVGKEGRSRWAP